MPIKVKFRLLILLLGTLSFFSCSANKHQKSIDNNIKKSTATEFDEILKNINSNDSLIKLLNDKNLYYEELLLDLNNKVSLLSTYSKNNLCKLIEIVFRLKDKESVDMGYFIRFDLLYHKLK